VAEPARTEFLPLDRAVRPELAPAGNSRSTTAADIAAILVKAGLGTSEAVREWLTAEYWLPTIRRCPPCAGIDYKS
jgi:hypothetical protein